MSHEKSGEAGGLVDDRQATRDDAVDPNAIVRLSPRRQRKTV